MRTKVWATILVILAVIALVWWAIGQFGVTVERQSLDNVPPTSPPVISAQEYQTTVNSILQPAFTAAENATDLTTEQIAIFESAKQEILKLRVPRNLQDIHLQLVIALANIEQGLTTSDISTTEKGWASLQQAKQQYEWLN